MAKTCSNGCSYPVFSKGLCTSCWRKEYAKTIKKNPNAKPPKRTAIERSNKPINKVSKNRQKQLDLYYPLREAFLKVHKWCELKVDSGCTKKATEVHHAEGRHNDLLLNVEKFKAACRHCHDIVTKNSKEAIENGQSLSKHKKKDG